MTICMFDERYHQHSCEYNTLILKLFTKTICTK
jgi:hypothetical protein